jgi:hypothetical protein
MSTFAGQVKAQFNAILNSSADEAAQLNNALRLLSKWRSVLIQNTILKNQGTVVMQGPLSGMDFLSESAEGCHIAKLLGCYEQPLQPFIEQAIASAYPIILILVVQKVITLWGWPGGCQRPMCWHMT